VATWALKSDDCVLEIGGGIGAVSCQIQNILTGANRQDHAVVEAQATLCENLNVNKKLNNCEFTVHCGALSVEPIYSCPKMLLEGPDSKNLRQWMFNFTSDTAGNVIVFFSC